MSDNKPNKTFIIRNKTTKELWRASSGKTSWKQPNHAKSAWKASPYAQPVKLRGGGNWNAGCKFNDQDMFEIVELKSEDETLTKLKSMVEGHFKPYGNPRCDESLYQCDHYSLDLDELVANIMEEFDLWGDGED